MNFNERFALYKILLQCNDYDNAAVKNIDDIGYLHTTEDNLSRLL